MFVCRVLLLPIALVVLCLTNGVLSAKELECYICDSLTSIKECDKPKKQTCTPSLANTTVEYLNRYYDSLNSTITEIDYNCINDEVNDNNFNVRYKGCVYSYMHACFLVPTRSHTPNNFERYCRQCDSGYCNPAPAMYGNALLVLFTTLLTAFKWLC